MSYQCASCDGQKYGPLKISCRPRICTPRLPASSMSGMCASIDGLANVVDRRRRIGDRRGGLDEAAEYRLGMVFLESRHCPPHGSGRILHRSRWLHQSMQLSSSGRLQRPAGRTVAAHSSGFRRSTWPRSWTSRSPASASRTRSCSRRRRRPSPTATSCARSTPAGAASSPRRSACTRSSTSPGRRRSSCAPRPTRRVCR